jgi:hypothetical protein
MGLVHHLNRGMLFLSSASTADRRRILSLVGAGSLELGEGLSEPVAATVPAVIAAIPTGAKPPASDGSVRTESNTDPSVSINLISTGYWPAAWLEQKAQTRVICRNTACTRLSMPSCSLLPSTWCRLTWLMLRPSQDCCCQLR